MASAWSKHMLNTSEAVVVSLTWTLFTIVMLTTKQTMADDGDRPPLPPTATSHNPTWQPESETGGKTTTNDTWDDLFGDWPWWWWIAATAGGVFILIVLIALCVCLCLRHRKRRASQGREMNDTEEQTAPADLRRMDSSAAKRYLLNIASVFSWGSDFEFDGGRSRPTTKVIYANSAQDNAVYANPQNLGIVNNSLSQEPPSRMTNRRKSSHHYLNLG